MEEGGHEVIGEATNGMEGIEKFKELQPDITTLDITMPILDGLGALKWIMEYDPSATVIMVSSSAQPSKIAEAITMGAVDFLPKPFESLKIIDTIAHLFDYENLDDLIFDEDFI